MMKCRRVMAELLLLALITGSISTASFARNSGVDCELVVEAVGELMVEEGEGELELEEASPSEATPSQANQLRASMLRTTPATGTPEDVTNQISVLSSRTYLAGNLIADQQDSSVVMNQGQRIEENDRMRYELEIQFYPNSIGLGEGDYACWTLGRMRGLDLPPELREDIVMSAGGPVIGEAILVYEADGTLKLKSEFVDDVLAYYMISIHYTYECGFLPVQQDTVVEMLLPGWQVPISALIPGVAPSTATESSAKPTTPEETTPEETSPEETTPEETSPEATTPEETSPEETTTAEETKGSHSGGGSSSSGGGSSNIWTGPGVVETSAVESESVPETPESESAEVQELPVEKVTEPATEPEPEEIEETEEEILPEIPDIGTLHIETSCSGNSGAGGGNGNLKEDIPGEILTYTIVVRNEGADTLTNIRFRDYLPKHTRFVSANSEGKYGVIDGKERVTWSLSKLEPGEEQVLNLVVQVYQCTPVNYVISNEILYQLEDFMKENGLSDPDMKMEFPNITID